MTSFAGPDCGIDECGREIGHIGEHRRDPATEPSNHTGGNVCVECGGGECGLHPAGCVYGGFSALTGYWLVDDGCALRHD